VLQFVHGRRLCLTSRMAACAAEVMSPETSSSNSESAWIDVSTVSESVQSWRRTTAFTSSFDMLVRAKPGDCDLRFGVCSLERMQSSNYRVESVAISLLVALTEPALSKALPSISLSCSSLSLSFGTDNTSEDAIRSVIA
jgi:hypothetical protein